MGVHTADSGACFAPCDRGSYLVLEFVPGGELFRHLRKLRKIPVARARLYIAEITLALQALHKSASASPHHATSKRGCYAGPWPGRSEGA